MLIFDDSSTTSAYDVRLPDAKKYAILIENNYFCIMLHNLCIYLKSKHMLKNSLMFFIFRSNSSRSRQMLQDNIDSPSMFDQILFCRIVFRPISILQNS